MWQRSCVMKGMRVKMLNLENEIRILRQENILEILIPKEWNIHKTIPVINWIKGQYSEKNIN